MRHQIFHVRVSDGRRVVLPAEVCKQLKVAVGGTIIVDVVDDGVELRSFDSTLKNFRQLLASKVPSNVSIVDELLAERRADAARE